MKNMDLEDDGDEDDEEEDDDDDDDDSIESYDDEDEIDIFKGRAVVDEFIAWLKDKLSVLQERGIVESDTAIRASAGEAKEEANDASILPRLVAAGLF